MSDIEIDETWNRDRGQAPKGGGGDESRRGRGRGFPFFFRPLPNWESMFRAWKPGFLGLKGSRDSHVSIRWGKALFSKWWILMGRRNENSRFSRVFSRLELLICLSRYEYVNRIVAKRRNEGDFEVRSWKLYCDGIRVFLMRYLSFRADIEWIEFEREWKFNFGWKLWRKFSTFLVRSRSFRWNCYCCRWWFLRFPAENRQLRIEYRYLNYC